MIVEYNTSTGEVVGMYDNNDIVDTTSTTATVTVDIVADGITFPPSVYAVVDGKLEIRREALVSHVKSVQYETDRYEINRMCSRARSTYITPINGQLEVYTMKYQEAVQYLTTEGANLVDGSFPFIAAEATASGKPAADVAHLFKSKYEDMVRKLAEIERIRTTVLAEYTVYCEQYWNTVDLSDVYINPTPAYASDVQVDILTPLREQLQELVHTSTGS